MDAETQEYCSMLRRDPCSYCGQTDAIEVDHIVPLTKGGKDHWSNFTASCSRCNTSKGGKKLVGFMAYKPIGSVVRPGNPKSSDHKVQVYVPIALWKRFEALRNGMTIGEAREHGNVSKMAQEGIKRKISELEELERAKGEKR